MSRGESRDGVGDLYSATQDPKFKVKEERMFSGFGPLNNRGREVTV